MWSMGNIAGTEPRSTFLTGPFRVNADLFTDLFTDFMTGWPRDAGPKAVAFLLLALGLTVPKFATCQTSEEQVELSFRAGQAALRQGEFVRATQEFKKVLALDPTLVEAEVNLALAYQSLFDYDLAVRYLTKALGERPNLPGATAIVGMDYLKLGFPEKASPFLRRALQLEPSNRDTHEAMALYHLSQENFRGAAVEFRQIADLDSDKTEAWFKLGHEYLDLAARLAYRGARLYRESAWGHRFLGDILFQRTRWEDATQEYRKALGIEPRQSGLHTLLGEAYLHAGKLEEAETEFQLDLQLDSRNELAWLGLANLQLAKGQVSEALASEGKVWQISPEFLKLRPEFPSIELTKEAAQASISRLLDQPEGPAKHSFLAGLYASMNENALSEREWQSFQDDFSKWQQASRATPQTHANPDPCKAHLYSHCIASLQTAKHPTDSAQLLLGKTYFTLQQYERAAGALAQVHGDANVNAEASYWLERTYQALGAEAYARLEDSFPDSWRTHQLRAEGSAIRRDLDDAIKEYQAALRLRPDEAELHEALGEFYLDNHTEVDARSELEKAVTLDPSRTKALYLLGRLYVLDRENEKAVPYLQRALRLQPNLNEASGLLGTAYVHMGQFADAIPRLEKAAPLDHYGNVHYQLYLAYRKLGHAELAQKALARSQDLRRSSLERDQALIMGSPQVEPEPQ
jgi:tetratricopeptide (TPR) repeat protein